MNKRLYTPNPYYQPILSGPSNEAHGDEHCPGWWDEEAVEELCLEEAATYSEDDELIEMLYEEVDGDTTLREELVELAKLVWENPESIGPVPLPERLVKEIEKLAVKRFEKQVKEENL